MTATPTLTLSAFLERMLSADEAAARAAGAEEWYDIELPGPTMRKSDDEPTTYAIDSHPSLIAHDVTNQQRAEHISRHDPARVLAEVASKRAILERHTGCDDAGFGEPCPIVAHLAAVYADHPDYDPSWAA